MPIKFRCHYCSQMLGISNSRAGAVVDCPGCGRTLRVPLEDGSVGRPVTTIRHGHRGEDQQDTELIEVLASLANLAPGSPVQNTPVQNTPVHDSHGEQSEETFEQPPFNKDVPEPVSSQMATVCETGPQSDPSPQLQSLRRKYWGPGLPVGIAFGVILTLIFVQFSNINITPFRFAPAKESLSTTVVQPSETNPKTSTTDEALNTQLPDNDLRDSKTVKTVTGQLSWRDSNRLVQPDSHALALLLPARNPGRLRLDGTSLRELHTNIDQKAVAAALNELDASFIRTDDEGRFELPLTVNAPHVLVLISRHKTRATDAIIPPDVDAGLSQYFQSSATIAGRLACRAINIADPEGQLPSFNIEL